MTNFVGFSNDELAALPALKAGDRVKCPHCGKRHRVFAGIVTATRQPSDLLFYQCGVRVFLAGVAGRNVMERAKK